MFLVKKAKYKKGKFMEKTELIELLNDLLTQPQEQQWLEFKLNGATKNEEIGEYISALSNGATLANQPYGYLVWGVENEKHNILGTKFVFSKARNGSQALELWLRNLLIPKVNFEIFEFSYQQKSIVLLRIPPAKGEPVRFKQEAWVRLGSHKTKLSGHPELMRIIYNSQEDWSKKVIERASLADLDETALKLAREKFREKKPELPVHSWNDKTFLDRAGLTIDGKITPTTLLLLGKPESVHYLSPAVANITWKLDTEEKAYEHFSPPFLLNTEQVKNRIRNIKHQFFPHHELLATTVDKYDPKTILEALHNCIAHQDYSLRGKIVIIEQIDKLVFENLGTFFDGKPEDYLLGKKTPSKYRNEWLAKAMSNLGMIDTVGYGINRMCQSQRERYFPLPEYILSEQQKVILHIYGKVIDEKYSNLLIQRGDLSLEQVLALDRVQKKQPISEFAVVNLRKNKLLEGRKPNYFISAKVAKTTGQKAEYTKHKALDERYYMDLILSAIKQHGEIDRRVINELLLDKLSDLLTDKQRITKIGNIIYKMKRTGKIANRGSDHKPRWVLPAQVSPKPGEHIFFRSKL
jgi:ATP-dependent DNA helicase RecG